MIQNNNIQQITKIINDFSRDEIIWLSGYLSALIFDKPTTKTGPTALSIIYISETGNAKFLATTLANTLKKHNFAIKLKSATDYRLQDLKKESNLVLITSTHGEGEIPESGHEFFAGLKTLKDLTKLNFYGIGLGDSSYPLFCEAIKKFSAVLTNNGAKEIAKPTLLDLDFESHLEALKQQIINNFSDQSQPIPNAITSTKTEIIGEIVSNINLNDIGSSKETRHIEIALQDQVSYQPGDSIAILLGQKELKIKEPITPRQYSIASSPTIHDGEIHLTVGLVKYLDKNGSEKRGLFSNYLSNLKEGDKIKFKVTPNRNFRLPKDPNANIILAGAGTGIAPFRSFLFERSAQEITSKAWLFFGNRNFHTDFLYQSELQELLSAGSLNKIDVAFSRDQKQKIYIQDKIKENAKELFNWLEQGAYFYLCGDKNHMAQDVENSLLQIIKENSNQDPQQYLDKLTKEGRYLKDVY